MCRENCIVFFKRRCKTIDKEPLQLAISKELRTKTISDIFSKNNSFLGCLETFFNVVIYDTLGQESIFVHKFKLKIRIFVP